MKDFLIRCEELAQIEIYGAVQPLVSVPVQLFHDRYFSTEQWTDKFEDDGETFYVFSVVARDVPSIPCGLGDVTP